MYFLCSSHRTTCDSDLTGNDPPTNSVTRRVCETWRKYPQHHLDSFLLRTLVLFMHHTVCSESWTQQTQTQYYPTQKQALLLWNSASLFYKSVTPRPSFTVLFSCTNDTKHAPKSCYDGQTLLWHLHLLQVIDRRLLLLLLLIRWPFLQEDLPVLWVQQHQQQPLFYIPKRKIDCASSLPLQWCFSL